MIDITLQIEPVSTLNPAFLALAYEHLARNEVLILLVRYANCGGAKNYLIIRTKDEFGNLIKTLAFKTSITVFFESAFALNGKVNAELLKRVYELFTKEYDEYEGLDIICLEPQKGDIGTRNILFMHKIEEINDWFRQHQNLHVLIGTMKFWCGNNQDFITAYVPDGDGQVRPGAY